MAIADSRLRNFTIAAAIILLPWLEHLEAGRSARLSLQPAQGGVIRLTVPFEDGFVCEVLFPVVDFVRVRVPDGRIGMRLDPVNGGAPRTPEEATEITRIAELLNSALKGSDDMRTKVREACTVHQTEARTADGKVVKINRIVVGLTWNDPDLMTAMQLTGSNQIALDVGDIPQVANHLDSKSQAANDVVSNNWLTSALAHEFDHARERPGQADHRDPAAACTSDPQDPGKPSVDQNQVIKDLNLGITRLQYTYMKADGTTATDYEVALPNGETHEVTMNITSLTGATFTDLPPPTTTQPQQPAGPPQQPAGPPAPPRQPAGPPAPPQQHPGGNHMATIPEVACEGQTSTGCYPLPGATDKDFDGVPDLLDNCPGLVNPQQADGNGNGIGDDCERGLKPCAGGGLFTRPLTYSVIAGGVLLPLLLGGDGGGATTSVTPTTPAPTTTAPPPVTPAPTPAPPPPTPPAPQPASFTVALQTGWNHPQGATESEECKVIITDPAQSEADFRVQITGPGVVPGQNISGRLDARGRGSFRVRINQVGSYTNVVTVTSRTGFVSSATAIVTVTGANNTCPTP